MERHTPVPRFFEQYTLHYIRQHTSDQTLLQVSIAAWRYGVAPLRAGPRPAVTPGEVRATVYPRWRELLDEPARLGTVWDNALTLAPSRPPALEPKVEARPPAPLRLESGDKWLRRIDRLERLLEVAETAFRAFGALAALVNDWRLRRQQRALLDAQRELLQAALSQNLAGADEALRLAQEPGFVTGYLAVRTGDDEEDVEESDDT
ncbi:MAG: hypothetical protein JXB47_04465 [Anaerolineae bacterium]|nr:hypothetical protein [Anaerolineae bacterium]